VGALVLTREAIRDGFVRRMIADAGIDMRVLDEAEIESSRRAALDGAAGRPIWIFAYGSLLWNPAFHFAERRLGRVHGYHRRFCLWTRVGRGNEREPGLLLGLERGGSCRGVAFRIARDRVEEETRLIWAREMISDAYCPRWVRVRTDHGAIAALAFVINRRHERYTGSLAEETVARAVAAARGELGSCADYLLNTVRHLDELGIRDERLRRVAERVAAAWR
jgi:cation transport protein ChaC